MKIKKNKLEQQRRVRRQNNQLRGRRALPNIRTEENMRARMQNPDFHSKPLAHSGRSFPVLPRVIPQMQSVYPANHPYGAPSPFTASQPFRGPSAFPDPIINNPGFGSYTPTGGFMKNDAFVGHPVYQGEMPDKELDLAADIEDLVNVYQANKHIMHPDVVGYLHEFLLNAVAPAYHSGSNYGFEEDYVF